MCQLFLVSCSQELDEKISPIILDRALRIDSQIQHRDGCGIFSRGSGIWRSNLTASILMNLGNFTKHVGKTAIGHVRAASLINGKKEIKREFSHPFESNSFILMHNGFLQEKIGATPVDITDSENFLKELEKEYTKLGNTYNALVSTMKNFEGKFAFLIFSKNENIYYVVRGSTADLHSYQFKIDGKPSVLLVNTNKNDLSSIMFEVSNLLNIFTGKNVTFDLNEIKLLEKNTVFILNEKELELVKVGEIVENFPIAKSYSPALASVQAVVADMDQIIKELKSIMKLLGCDIYYLNNTLFPLLIGKSLMECTANDIREALPYIKQSVLTFIKVYGKKLSKKADRIREKSNQIVLNLAIEELKLIPEYFILEYSKLKNEQNNSGTQE